MIHVCWNESDSDKVGKMEWNYRRISAEMTSVTGANRLDDTRPVTVAVQDSQWRRSMVDGGM